MVDPLQLLASRHEIQGVTPLSTATQAARRATAEAWYQRSDLNGYHVENADGWEHDGANVFSRTLFVKPEKLDLSLPFGANKTDAKKLHIQFKAGEAVIDHANIDGDEVDGSQDWKLPGNP